MYTTRMRQFFRDMWATFWLLFWLTVGLFIMIQLLRFFNTDGWQRFFDASLAGLQRADSIESAVRIIGSIFATIFGLRILDRFPFRGAITRTLGFKPGRPSFFQFLTFPLVHRDDNHLFANTRFLLLFAGIMAILVPTIQAFITATVVVLLISTVGFLLFAKKDTNQIGASGILLGYYSFNILYGLFGVGNWGTITAVFMLVLFGRQMWRTLRNQDEGISQVGHIAGFVGGVFGAAVLVRLGMF